MAPMGSRGIAAPIALLLQLVLACSWKMVVDWSKQEALSLAINDTTSSADWKGSVQTNHPSSSPRSAMHDACHSLHGHADFSRLACCQPEDVRILYNVQVYGAEFGFFGGAAFSKLPTIKNVQRHGRPPQPFTMSIRAFPNNVQFGPEQCRGGTFDGTLHIFSRSLAHNVYHTVVDNFLPLVSQIVLDAYFGSPFLHRPRMFLSNIHAGVDEVAAINVSAASSSSSSATSHMELVRNLFSAGHASLSALNGVCFRRVVWNGGVRALYHNTLSLLRRHVTDLSRALVMHLYRLPQPLPLQLPPPEGSGATQATLQGLRVVVFTRGSGGDGRSLANETLLVTRLQEHGARAMLCCDFQRTGLGEQLVVAAQADVIVGLHGAALVHGVFAPRGLLTVELKLHYGYASSLFALVSDSRAGTHAHIDARAYNTAATNGGPLGRNRPIDDALADRVVAIIKAAKGGGGLPPPSASASAASDTLLLLPPPGKDSHTLGQALGAIKKECHSTPLFRYQLALIPGVAKGEPDSLHCAAACRQWRDGEP